MSYSRRVNCPQCTFSYTKRGLSRHIGRSRCKHNQEFLKNKEIVDKTIQLLRQRGKARRGIINRTFINALRRRGLLDIVGATLEYTRTVQNMDGKWLIEKEWWVDSWVVGVYSDHLCGNKHGMHAYEWLEEYKDLSEDQKEKARAMISLRSIKDQ